MVARGRHGGGVRNRRGPKGPQAGKRHQGLETRAHPGIAEAGSHAPAFA